MKRKTQLLMGLVFTIFISVTVISNIPDKPVMAKPVPGEIIELPAPVQTPIAVMMISAAQPAEVSVKSAVVSKEPTPKPTPKPTPRYGKWDEDDYAVLSTVIYFEAGPNATLESACAVGWVVRNRLEDGDRWGDHTFAEVIYRTGQFSVTRYRAFDRLVPKIVNDSTDRAHLAKRAARYVMQGRDKYRLPKDVQAFHSGRHSKSWGKHKFYKTIGGNDFYRW